MFLWRYSGLGIGAPVRGPVRRAASHPPLRPAGRSPCPPCAAAVPPPARPACGSPGNVAAGRRLRRLRPSQPPAVARGHPVRPQGQAPAGPLRGPCPRPAPRRLRRWCSGAARPPRCGGCGAVRPSGPGGGAPASLASPATPAAQAVPRGSAYALAARRSGPSGLALRGSAHSRLAAPQALAPLRAAGSLPACAGRSARAAAAGRNLDRRAHWRRKRRLPAHSRAAGRGERRLRAGVPAVSPAGKAKASPAQGGKPPTCGGLACRCPGQRGQNVAGVPPSGGFPPLSHSGKTVVLLCLLLLVVCLLLAGSGGWSAGLAVCLAGRCPGLLGRSGHLLWRRLLPVSWRRNLRRAVSGLLVRRSVGWRLCGANKNPPPGDKSGEGFLASINDAGPKRQHARRQRRTAYESKARHTGAAPVGGFLRR